MAATVEIEYLLRIHSPIPRPPELEAIEEEVCAFVDAAKREGLRPEHILVVLRASMRRAAPQLSERIAQRLVSTCIRRYFYGTSLADSAATDDRLEERS